MFDIGFWELVVIAIVALVAVGPERLPQLVRDTGRWLRTARRMVSDTRAQIQRELDLDEKTGFQRRIADLDSLMKQAPDRGNQAGDKPS